MPVRGRVRRADVACGSTATPTRPQVADASPIRQYAPSRNSAPPARHLVLVKRSAAVTLVVLALAACSSSHGPSHLPRPSRTPIATTPTTERSDALSIPDTYEQACLNEPSVCEHNTTGVVPDALKRPLRLETVGSGRPCPVSSGVSVDNGFFVGVALGRGPVRPIPAAGGDLRHGVVVLSRHTDTPGWLAFKTLWFSEPSYQGPFVIRAKRIDGSGPIAFGETPTLAPLVVPPGETLNSSAGYRTAPGGTWVKAPGCYAWQVDGLNFSNVIVVNAVLPAP